MWFDYDVLRISYLPVVLIPILLGILSSQTTFIEASDLIIGWALLAIGQNTLNDAYDKDRKLHVKSKGLISIYIVSTFLGLILTRSKLLLSLLYVVVVSLYNTKIKGMFLLEVILLTLVHVALPFLSVSDNMLILVLLFILGAASDLVHRICDPEHRNYKKTVKLVMFLCIVGLIYTTYLLALAPELYYLAPFALYFIFCFYGIWKHPKPEAKVIGAYVACLTTFYLIGIIIELNKFI